MPGLKRTLTRVDFQQLADDRLEDAQTLLNAGRWVAAYYVAGYSIECALKAGIAKTIGEHQFPDKHLGSKAHVHDPKALLALAGTEDALTDAMQGDHHLAGNWGVVANWSETVRYYGATQEDAEALIGAITDAAHGVLPWIKHRW